MISKNSPLYRCLQWGLFPALFLGSFLTCQALLNTNIDGNTGVDSRIAMYGTIFGLMLVIFSFEHLMPYRSQWNKPAGDLSNDVISAFIAYYLIPLLVKPLYLALLASATAWLALQYGGDIWPSDWPLFLQLILMMVVADAGRYWGHRLAHEIPFLWRFHAIHHSSTRLWFFNGMRQHPMDKLWFMFSELFFPILLGVNGDVLAVYLVATACCGYFQHCNIDVKLGWLYYIFNIVTLHRWHHSQKIAESDNNYGNNLIIFDWLFGTRFLPKNAEVAEIGLLNQNYPQTYWQQFIAPFRYPQLDKAPQAQQNKR